MLAHVCSHEHTHSTHVCVCSHTCTRVYAPAHTCTRIHTHYTHLVCTLTPTYSQSHTDTHTCTHQHTHWPARTRVRAATCWQDIHTHSTLTCRLTHTITHIHPPIPPSEIAPLLPTMTSLKKGQGLPDGWDGKAGPPCSFPTPTPIAQGNSDSPAWSGCHAGRGWPPEPPYGRRTSRRHSLLREKGNG